MKPLVLEKLDKYQVNLYYPVIDALFFELKRRFTDKNKHIMRAVQACNPTSSTFLDPKHLEPLVSTYCLDMDLVKLESPVAKRTLAKKDIQEISDVVIELAPLKAAFLVIVRVLQIAMTISVTSASVKGLFQPSSVSRHTFIHQCQSNVSQTWLCCL